nr:reverse transcriptase domain-containing protein [Tanacetum cinerariifolium]
MSISSYSDGPSCGIPRMNAGVFPEMDPYEEALIDAFAARSSLFPLPPTSLAYDHAPLGHRTTMIRRRDDIPEDDMPPQRRFAFTAHPPGCDIAESSAAATRAPRSQYDFVDTVKERHGLIQSPGHDARTIARAADIVKDLHDAQSDRRDIKLEIDAVRGQMTAYETELHEGTLKKKMTDKYCTKGKIKKLEIKLWNFRVNGNDVAAYTQCFQELALMCTKFLANETKKVDKYISGLPDNIHGNVMSARPMTLNETIELANDLMDQKLCTYAKRQNDNKRKTDDSLRNSQQQNGNRNGLAQGRAYALGGRDASPDFNIITGTFLLNKRYAKILFDTGVDKSFVSTTFSALINITPTTLENHYDVELADGKIIGVNTIVRGCTLNFMNHPFNIDLMPVPLSSFSFIIGIDWLTKYHGVIICDEKIVRVPFEREMLMFQGNRDNQREESRLNIISCTKEGKRLEDVPSVRDFPKVFPEDLSGIPPTQQVEFQIELIKPIKYWASPKSPMEIRQFLGLAGYYRRFIEGFSKIMKSMTKLTQKNVKLDWGEKEEAAFQLIKQKLCSVPILVLPKGSENFIVYCDASYKGLGVVLMQNEKC